MPADKAHGWLRRQTFKAGNVARVFPPAQECRRPKLLGVTFLLVETLHKRERADRNELSPTAGPSSDVRNPTMRARRNTFPVPFLGVAGVDVRTWRPVNGEESFDVNRSSDQLGFNPQLLRIASSRRSKRRGAPVADSSPIASTMTVTTQELKRKIVNLAPKNRRSGEPRRHRRHGSGHCVYRAAGSWALRQRAGA
jgi:hypothetical protein